jgi:tetratricopeptide (TPR) repeat protein
MSRAYLAPIYQRQKRWEDSERLLLQISEVQKKVLGAEHPSTLISLGNLALTHHNLGRKEDAEKLYLQVLHTQQKILGPSHPNTVATKHNLALTYSSQRRHEDAKELLMEVVYRYTEELGSEHQSTVTSMSNLAIIDGKWKQAQKLDAKNEFTRLRAKFFSSKQADTEQCLDALAYWQRGPDHSSYQQW